MALSGTISGSRGGYTLKTNWSATQNISGNYSNITCQHQLVLGSGWDLYISGRSDNYCTIGSDKKSFSSPSISSGGNQTLNLGTTTHLIYHDNNGYLSTTLTSAFFIRATIGGNYYESITASGTVNPTSIPRQAILDNCTNFTDLENPSIVYRNPAGFPMTFYLGTQTNPKMISRTNVSNTGSYTFNLTTSELNQLLQASANVPTLTVRYTIETNINGSLFESIGDRTFTVVNANPTFGSYRYNDTNPVSVAITLDNQRIIQNVSFLTFNFGVATAYKYATISKYQVTFNGVTLYNTSSGNIEFNTVDVSSNTVATLSVVDSRGKTTSVNVTVIVDSYFEPTLSNVILARANNFDNTTYLTVNGYYATLNGKNDITIKYQYKKVSDSNYGSYKIIQDGVKETLSTDNRFNYNFNVTITDIFNSYSQVYVLSKGVPIFFIDFIKNSVGLNCFPTLDDNIEINGSTLLEYGTNSNGSFWKFFDGTLICGVFMEVYDQAIDSSYGTLFFGNRNWTYPNTFIANPFVYCSYFKWSTGASWGTVSDIFIDYAVLRGIDAFTRASGERVRICAYAIGRWK